VNHKTPIFGILPSRCAAAQSARGDHRSEASYERAAVHHSPSPAGAMLAPDTDHGKGKPTVPRWREGAWTSAWCGRAERVTRAPSL
jgi:hypothetical protein